MRKPVRTCVTSSLRRSFPVRLARGTGPRGLGVFALGSPTAASKALGIECACGALVPAYRLAPRLRPFAKNPRFFLIIASGADCKNLTVPSSRASYADPRFKKEYKLRQAIALKRGGAWCIYHQKTSYP